MWLVDNKIFPIVQIFFLFKGHTKNLCNGLFNFVKWTYHKVNTFTYDKVYNTVNKNPYISVHRMQPENFYDHQEWWDKMYQTPASGEFKQSHVFTIYSNNGRANAITTFIKKDIIVAPERLDSLVPRRGNRKARVLPVEERKKKLARHRAYKILNKWTFGRSGVHYFLNM